MSDERRCDLILWTQWIGGTEPDIRSACLESFHQIGRFSRDMEAGRDAEPGKRFLPLKSFLDQSQHRHGRFGPFDLEFALVSQLDILHIVVHKSSLSKRRLRLGARLIDHPNLAPMPEP